MRQQNLWKTWSFAIAFSVFAFSCSNESAHQFGSKGRQKPDGSQDAGVPDKVEEAKPQVAADTVAQKPGAPVDSDKLPQSPDALVVQDLMQAKIAQIVDSSIDPQGSEGKVVGMIVGVITPEKRQVYGFGRTKLKGSQVPRGDNLYVLGSNTKVFSSLMLANELSKGTMNLQDPIEKYITLTQAPNYQGTSIRLQDLAAYTSALPLFAPNVQPGAEFRYSAELLTTFLNRYKPDYAPGTKYFYSNVAFQTLGHILATTSNKSFNDLLQDVVAKPLGMLNTTTNPSSEQLERWAPMYVNFSEGKVFEWTPASLPGAGWLMSSGDDMLSYLAALSGIDSARVEGLQKSIDLIETPIGPIPRSELHSPSAPDGVKAGLGLAIYQSGKTTYFAKTGGGNGAASQILFSKEPNAGVFILTNTAVGNRIDISTLVFQIYEVLLNLPADSVPRFTI